MDQAEGGLIPLKPRPRGRPRPAQQPGLSSSSPDMPQKGSSDEQRIRSEEEATQASTAFGAGPVQLPGGMDADTLQHMLQAQRQQLAASPLMQQAITNPQVISDALASNPAARHVMEQNPRLHQLMTDPDALRGMLSGDPDSYRGVLGDNVEQHLDTIASLNTYSQRLRQDRAGSAAQLAMDLGGASGEIQPAPVEDAGGTTPQLPVSRNPDGQLQATGSPSVGPDTSGSRWGAGLDEAQQPLVNGRHHHWQNGSSGAGNQTRPQLPHADVVFPIGYCVLYAVLCLTIGPAVPFWLLLLSAPILMLAGIQFVVLKAGGIPPREMPATRFTLTLVATLEALTFTAFVAVIYPAVPQRRLLRVVELGVATLALIQHYRAAARKPDFVQGSGAADPEAGPPSGAPRFNMGLCEACGAIRPLRSKHCNHCKRCIRGSDHHCPVINTCVGQGNAKLFFVYIGTLLLAQLMFLRLATDYAATLVQAPKLSAIAALWRASSVSPGVVLLAYTQVFASLFNAVLVVRMLLCIAAGLTTNELMRWRRFGYLTAPDDTYLNVFDRGPVANWLEFWRDAAPPDWGDVHHQRMQAGPEAAATQAPRFSVTQMVRGVQTANAQLAASRARRRREREDHVLRTYGGVKDETLALHREDAMLPSGAGCSHCAAAHGVSGGAPPPPPLSGSAAGPPLPSVD